MAKNCKKDKKFYGTTTIGEKGQVVVPAEARQDINLVKGNKLLVFGFGDDILVFSKLENLEKFASHLSKQLKEVKDIIKKTENK